MGNNNFVVELRKDGKDVINELSMAEELDINQAVYGVNSVFESNEADEATIYIGDSENSDLVIDPITVSKAEFDVKEIAGLINENILVGLANGN